MKERPILFNGEMVKAILEGRKTQTRRVIKLQPLMAGDKYIWQEPLKKDDEFKLMGEPIDYDFYGALFTRYAPWGPKYGFWFKSPYGCPGDRLWVRETWASLMCGDMVYRATAGEQEAAVERWKPSIFMPRWAARILLEIINIRAERVQEITAEDALLEGINLAVPSGCNILAPPEGWLHWSKEKQDEWVEGQARATYFARCADAQDHVDAFKTLWDSINAKPKAAKKNPYTGVKEVCFVSYPWEDMREIEKYRGKIHYIVGNPWVWADTFKRIET